MSDVEIFYNGKQFEQGDTIPLEDIKAAKYALPITKQKIPANFRYEPEKGARKKNLLKSLWEDPAWRLVILAPFLLALLIFLDEYGLLPYQW